MNKIDIHVFNGSSVTFTGVYRGDLQTESQHFYETMGGEIKSFDKASIMYVSELIDVVPDGTLTIGDHMLIEPTDDNNDSLIFNGVKHPSMIADNWGYYITTDRELLHVNRRYYNC